MHKWIRLAWRFTINHLPCFLHILMNQHHLCVGFASVLFNCTPCQSQQLLAKILNSETDVTLHSWFKWNLLALSMFCYKSFLICLTAITQEIMPSTWDKPLRQLVENGLVCAILQMQLVKVKGCSYSRAFIMCMVIHKNSCALLFFSTLKEKKQSYFTVKEQN